MDFSSLTPAQQKAVRYRGGPLMVVAGPGTGKTRTLTFRIAHLLETRIARPDQILGITFTNKAADEIRTRIEGLAVQTQLSHLPRVTTFHGFCFRFLHENLAPPSQLLSETEALTVLKEAVREKDPRFPAPQFKELSRRISAAKNNRIPAADSSHLPEWETYPAWPGLYRAYQDKLSHNNYWDFDELILQALALLEDNPQLQTDTRQRYPFVLVDEFQDINLIQFDLFKRLTRLDEEWMVIGDPNQAIYGFRGASADFFSRLKQETPSLAEIRLEETFRLNQTILTASSQVIRASSLSPSPTLISTKKGEPFISVMASASDDQEGVAITRLIEVEMGGLGFLSKGEKRFSETRHKKPRSFADFAVLYRLHLQGETIARAFLKKGIPFQRVQEIHWAERPEVRTCLTYLKRSQPLEIPPAPALNELFSRGVVDPKAISLEGADALKKLLSWAAAFKGTLGEFLDLLSVQTGLDTYEPDQEKVSLLTLHAAKGLEFPFVIIAGCEANLLPLSLLKESDPEEERRLFYVGLTRAQDKLVLTWARKRNLFGQYLSQSPSPFLEDIEAELKSQVSSAEKKPSAHPKKKQMSLFS
jgi:DNA helicase-2/ATP-dependent DNA helicase PcrA